MFFSNNVKIIAEIGVNHNGDVKLAKKLIDAANKAGADFVKFQSFISEEGITNAAIKAPYQKKNTSNPNESQLEMVKKYELTHANHYELLIYCKKKKINFISSAFDLKSLKFLKSLNLKLWKIPSGEITNYPYLEFIGKQNQKTILSTGMSNIDEIKIAKKILNKNGLSDKNLVILHCNTDYPTDPKDVNLKCLNTIAKKFNVEVGYSDHTADIEVPIAAVALGAKVIEKHFTIDKSLDGPDHKASLEPEKFSKMVRYIRNIELALGDGIKKPSQSEIKNINIVRKSLVANKDIKKGEKFKRDNLAVKRPGTGINPINYLKIIGKVAKKKFKKNDLIEI